MNSIGFKLALSTTHCQMWHTFTRSTRISSHAWLAIATCACFCNEKRQRVTYSTDVAFICVQLIHVYGQIMHDGRSCGVTSMRIVDVLNALVKSMLGKLYDHLT